MGTYLLLVVGMFGVGMMTIIAEVVSNKTMVAVTVMRFSMGESMTVRMVAKIITMTEIVMSITVVAFIGMMTAVRVRIVQSVVSVTMSVTMAQIVSVVGIASMMS